MRARCGRDKTAIQHKSGDQPTRLHFAHALDTAGPQLRATVALLKPTKPDRYFVERGP
jgi:hypothetical protein